MRFTLRDYCLVAVVLCNLHTVLSYDYEDIRSSYLARRAIDGTRGSKYYNPNEDGIFDDYSYDRGQYRLHQHKSGFSDIRRNVPGEPSVDYPTYERLPATSFSCEGRARGYYADEEAGCQAFHVCDELLVSSFLCPIGSLFSQELLTCDWWNKVDCSLSRKYFDLNRKIYAQDDGDEMLRKAIAMTGLHTGNEDYYVPEPEVRTRHGAGKTAVYAPYERTANDLVPNYVDFTSQGQARGSSRSRLPFTEETRTEAPKDIYADSPIIRIRNIDDDQHFTLQGHTRSSSDGQSGVRRPVNEYGNEYQTAYAPTVPTVTTTTRRYYSPTVPIIYNRVTTPSSARIDHIEEINPYDRVLFDSYGGIATPPSVFHKGNNTDYGDISPYNFDFKYEDMESRESIGLAKSNSERQLEKEEEASKEGPAKKQTQDVNKNTFQSQNQFENVNFSTTSKTFSKEEVLTQEEQDAFNRHGLTDGSSVTENYESTMLNKPTEGIQFQEPEIAPSSSDFVNIRSEEKENSKFDESSETSEHTENFDTEESISLVHAKIEGQLQLFDNPKENFRHINSDKSLDSYDQSEKKGAVPMEKTSTTVVNTFDLTTNLQPPNEQISSTLPPRNYTFSLEIELEPPISKPSEVLEPPMYPITYHEFMRTSKYPDIPSVTPTSEEFEHSTPTMGDVFNDAPTRFTSSTSLSSSAVAVSSSSSVSSSTSRNVSSSPPFSGHVNTFMPQTSSPVSVKNTADEKNVPFQISLQFNPTPNVESDARVTIDLPGHLISHKSVQQNIPMKRNEGIRERTRPIQSNENPSTSASTNVQYSSPTSYETHSDSQDTRDTVQSSHHIEVNKSFENFGARITSRNRESFRNIKRKIIDNMDPQSVNSGLTDKSSANKNVNNISRPDRLPRPFRQNDRKRNNSAELDDMRKNFYNHFVSNQNIQPPVQYESNESHATSLDSEIVDSHYANLHYSSNNKSSENTTPSIVDEQYVTNYFSKLENSTEKVAELVTPVVSLEENSYANIASSTGNYDGFVNVQSTEQQSEEYIEDLKDLTIKTSTQSNAYSTEEEYNKYGLTNDGHSSTYNPDGVSNEEYRSTSEFVGDSRADEEGSRNNFDYNNNTSAEVQDADYSSEDYSNANYTYNGNENEGNHSVYIENLTTENNNHFESPTYEHDQYIGDSNPEQKQNDSEVIFKRTESLSRDEIIDQLERHFGRPLFDSNGHPIFDLPKEKRELDFRSGLPISETITDHQPNDDSSQSHKKYTSTELRRNITINRNVTLSSQVAKMHVETEVIPSISFELDSDQGRKEYVDAVLKGIVTNEAHIPDVIPKEERTNLNTKINENVNNNDYQHGNINDDKDNKESVINVSSGTDATVLSESE